MASASCTPEKVTNSFSCAVCLEQFKDPKALQCLHTYCKECLVKLVKKKGSDHVIPCPECREDTKVTGGDVSKLPSNFWINNLQNTQRNISSERPVICEHCDSGDSAISHCSNCCVNMCEFCVTAHRRISTTKDHKILSLEEVRRLGTNIPKKPAMCGKHSGEILKLFCKTCQRIICRDCTIVDHREHNYNFVADVAPKERETLRGVLQETKSKERVVEEGWKVVKAMEHRVHDKAATVNKDVDAFFDNQVKELEHLRANLKREVSMQEQEKSTQLRRQREKLLFFLVQLKCGIKFCDQAMADGDNVALLSVKNQVVQRLSKLNAEQYDCHPCQDDFLKLCVCKRIADIGNMAVISGVPLDPEKCVLTGLLIFCDVAISHN